MWRSVLVVALTAVAQPAVQAAGWSDDFNDGNAEDGNPVTWTYNEIGFTPGIYSAASGDYSLSAPGGSNNDSLVATVGTSLANTYVRTQTISLPGTLPEETGGNVGVVARLDPFQLTGYGAILDDAGQLELLRIDFGAPVPLVPSIPGTGFDAITDVIIELNIVGDQLSVFAWRPGDAKPTTPLATAQDATYASGRAGIVFNEDDDNTTGVFRFAAAQDSPFVDVAPGDFDGDGDVDGNDFLVLQRGEGTGNIGADLTAWKANFGSGGAIAAVPEPGSLLLALTAGLAALGIRKKMK
jgi:hypothetical protein